MIAPSLLLKQAWHTAVLFQCYAIPLDQKRPVGGLRWRALVNATPSWPVMAEMPWKEATQYGIVLPDYMAVVDLDSDETGTLNTAWDELQAYPQLREALAANPYFVDTAGGGRHYYFRLPEDGGLSNGTLSDHIDLKTVKGYVVGPGSPGYRWGGAEPQDPEDLPILPFFFALGMAV